MRIWIFFSLLFFSILQAQCQEQKIEVRALETFHSIEVGESVQIYLIHGNSESARIEVINGDPSDVLTNISKGDLQISMRQGKIENFFKNVKVKLYLTYTKLRKIRATSASKVFSSGVIKAPSLNIKVTSASSVELSLNADKISIEVTSAGDATLMGKAKSLYAKVSSAGGLRAYQLNSQDAEIKASSAGLAKVAAARALRLEASSGATIYYQGDPEKIIIKSSSAGSIIKKEN